MLRQEDCPSSLALNCLNTNIENFQRSLVKSRPRVMQERWMVREESSRPGWAVQREPISKMKREKEREEEGEEEEEEEKEKEEEERNIKALVLCQNKDRAQCDCPRLERLRRRTMKAT